MGQIYSDQPFRILSLDGGGAKGFYTLGVLREIESKLGGKRLSEVFPLVFGTSTGAIIAALIALGFTVEHIYALYRDHVPRIARPKTPKEKSTALTKLAAEVFADKKFDAFVTGIGIVTTRWVEERPMIFKASIQQAHGSRPSFQPGFGCTIAEAVEASCAAYPFFNRKTVTTVNGDHVELIDGGYCANNPTLYAIADALIAMQLSPDRLRVISIGVGTYPEPKRALWEKSWWLSRMPSVQLLQKTMEISTQSLEQLRAILFKHVKTLRISNAYTSPEMATDLFEADMQKLNILRQRGVESAQKLETALQDFLP
ncbi:MAG: patatin-like phospholipase family protein [Burkholderiaceae bacterium]|nr:patatin-like phospholipase family protein [Burkholderiaceae bacterium]